MKFEPCSFERIDGVGYKKTKNFLLLEKFMNSGEPCVILKEYKHKNAYVCKETLKQSAIRFRMNDILVRVFDGEVYLIRKSDLEKYMKRQKEGQ